jgi:hypothetical protein
MTPVRTCIALAALALLPAAGCGGSETSTGGTGPAPAPAGASVHECSAAPIGISELRVTKGGCATAMKVASGWLENRSCFTPPQASRHSCRVDGWLCLGVLAERGIAAGCAQPGRSVSFLAAPRSSPSA